jgi:hypothetical protein
MSEKMYITEYMTERHVGSCNCSVLLDKWDEIINLRIILVREWE